MMENMENVSDNEKIAKLIEYYREKGLLIVGLNDSQGVNTTSTFFKKGLLEYLAAALTSEELTPDVINAFSLTMNKVEHIDYFLKADLSLDEIKLSQVYGVVSALQKVMIDTKLPKFLGNVGYAYKLIYRPKKGDEDIRISTALGEAVEPIMIYSSGVNNLMREVGSNPFAIVRDYKDRDKRPNYYYALDKTINPKTLNSVMDAIGKNFDSILSINSNTDIYTLGAYIPKSLRSEDMNIFRDLALLYNEKLSSLCAEYGATFVDTEVVGKNYNNSKTNFHISTAGHNALANYILGYIYHNKIEQQKKNEYVASGNFEVTGNGAIDVFNSVCHDYSSRILHAIDLDGYARDREFEIVDEHVREKEIFQKVLSKKNN